jgi:hypothetical protein
MIEITNEDSLFMWDALERLASLPEPYATQLRKLWNAWLRDKYPTRDALRDAWGKGIQPAGANLIREIDFARLGRPGSLWIIEEHGDAKMAARRDGRDAVLSITHPDATDWHLQLTQGRLRVKKGQFYTLRFRASAQKPVTIRASLAQAHEPYRSYGSGQVELTPTPGEFAIGVTPTQDDDNARITFVVGQIENTIRLSDAQLRPGGQRVLDAGEDPAADTVAARSAASADSDARVDDWYAFLQATEQRFFTRMRSYLKETLGVKGPVTGTIGFTPLSTQVQAQMDFVDAHGYFDHPHFPRRPWDAHDWTITDRALVDHPGGPPLWNIATTRVRGRPFTVTEYNHPAPNEWAAETVPLVATMAALQDWDAVFLFDYSHARPGDVRIRSYFNVEDNPTKMPLVPFGSRLFLGGAGGGGVRPIAAERDLVPQRRDMLRAARQYGEMGSFARDALAVPADAPLRQRLALWFEPAATRSAAAAPDHRVSWTASGPGTGRFLFADDHAAVFVGFAAGANTPIDLGPIRIDRLDTPFAALMLVPADPRETLTNAKRLLLAAVARAQNTGMRWSEKRKMLADWGKPPTQIEVVKAAFALSPTCTVYPLDPAGNRGRSIEPTSGRVILGREPTVWYEIVRR